MLSSRRNARANLDFLWANLTPLLTMLCQLNLVWDNGSTKDNLAPLLAPDVLRGERLQRPGVARLGRQPSEEDAKIGWPGSWANSSRLWLHSRGHARASLHILGRPDTSLAMPPRQIERV